jgi:hypothetical protein
MIKNISKGCGLIIRISELYDNNYNFLNPGYNQSIFIASGQDLTNKYQRLDPL